MKPLEMLRRCLVVSVIILGFILCATALISVIVLVVRGEYLAAVVFLALGILMTSIYITVVSDTCL